MPWWCFAHSVCPTHISHLPHMEWRTKKILYENNLSNGKCSLSCYSLIIDSLSFLRTIILNNSNIGNKARLLKIYCSVSLGWCQLRWSKKWALLLALWVVSTCWGHMHIDLLRCALYSFLFYSANCSLELGKSLFLFVLFQNIKNAMNSMESFHLL